MYIKKFKFLGAQIDENVSIYCDLDKKCKRGLQKIYDYGKKLFIANGVIKMQRHQLFTDNLSLRYIYL